jgi:hypothetical protein
MFNIEHAEVDIIKREWAYRRLAMSLLLAARLLFQQFGETAWCVSTPATARLEVSHD